MSEEKKLPSHRISFSEIKQDEQGNEKLGKPVEVAVVWPRDNGKKGGMIEWHISPDKLGEGAYFHLENEREQKQDVKQNNAFEQIDNEAQSQEAGLSRS